MLLKPQSSIKRDLNFLDLFAGAGGLSEGFIRAGFKAISHVESNTAACYTLKTRMVYHWLKSHNRCHQYNDYLCGKISRPDLYGLVPNHVIDSVINDMISRESMPNIFNKVDELLDGKKLDLIVGGPPCQAYSIIGRSTGKNGMKGDKRNRLYIQYVEFIERYKPAYFVFENVQGLLSAKDEKGILYFDDMKKMFFKAGYNIEYKILAADEYGILQHRKRVILVGRLGRRSNFYPEPKRWKPKVSVREVFNDLPSLKAGEGNAGACKVKKSTGSYLDDAHIRNPDFAITWHQARPHIERDLEIYRIAVDLWNKNKARLHYDALPDRLKTHRNRSSFVDRFKVVADDLPSSHTVIAHIAKDGHYYIHPDIGQNRSVTPREAARLQTFPDNYYFESVSGPPQRTSTFLQIGNAVPVLLAHKIAEKLKSTWQ